MGFLGELGKAFMGKPLGPQPENQSAQSTTPQTSNGIVDASGRKIIPNIHVKNIKSYRQGSDKLLVKGWVFNESADQIIRVDNSYLLKQKRTQNQEIGPGSSRELTLYDGPALHDDEHHAQITYRLRANGDVFMENYHIEYSRESDGTFLVEELHDDGPVRDI
jgi:hypothetical protein